MTVSKHNYKYFQSKLNPYSNDSIYRCVNTINITIFDKTPQHDSNYQ